MIDANRKIRDKYISLKRIIGHLEEDEVTYIPEYKECLAKLYELKGNYNLPDVVFTENGLQGIKDIDGKILVPAMCSKFFLGEQTLLKHFSLLMGCDDKDDIIFVSTDGTGTLLDPLIQEPNIPFYQYSFENDKFGLCDVERGIVTEPVLDEYTTVNEDMINVRCDNKWGIATRRLYVEPIYDEISQKDGCVYLRKGKKWGYITPTGEFVYENDTNKIESLRLLCCE